MKPSELNDRQKRMILEAKLTDQVLAERFGMGTRQISGVRAKLKQQPTTEAEQP